MKRNLDLVRHLLLSIEADRKYKDTQEAEANAKFADFYEDFESAVNEHNLWLYDAGFIEARIIKRGDGFRLVYPERLTWQGAEYLDCVRDSKIWRQTKCKLEQVGSASLPVVQKLAESIIKSILVI